MTNCPYGFRIVGATWETRRLVDAAALAGYAACDDRAEVGREAYLSAFQFGEDFRRLLLETGSTAGFSGPCWSPWLWWDVDNEENLEQSQADAGALVELVAGRYGVAPGELLIFFSGSKGFHLGLPTSLWSPAPSLDFHRTARRFAESVAELAAVTIDTGVYDKVRAFRAPNSRHPKTGLHKRRLTFDELRGPLDAILELATTPAPFAVPTPAGTSETAVADWQSAAALVASEGEAKAARRATSNGAPTLNRSTLDFIREGAGTGDRHRLLFSAAANLREFGCSPALAVALLGESALDSGLAPKDVRRQIECGLAAAGWVPSQQDATESTPTASDGSTVQEPPGRNTGDSGGSQRQSCQQVTGATDSTPPAELQAALAKLWGNPPSPPAPLPQAGEGGNTPALDGRNSPAVLPPLPSPFRLLPPDAVGSGILDKPCRCGSTEYVEMPISDGRTRRDCRKCGRFAGWGRWYDQGGPTR